MGIYHNHYQQLICNDCIYIFDSITPKFSSDCGLVQLQCIMQKQKSVPLQCSLFGDIMHSDGSYDEVNVASTDNSYQTFQRRSYQDENSSNNNKASTCSSSSDVFRPESHGTSLLAISYRRQQRDSSV